MLVDAEQISHLTGMRGDHHASLVAGQNGCDVLQLTQRPSIQDECRSWITVQQICGESRDRLFVEHSRADENRIAARDPLAQPDSGARIDLTRCGLRQAEDQRLRHSETEVGRDALAGRDLQLAGPGTQRSGRRQQGGARNRCASCNDQDTTALILVSVFSGLRERYAAEEFRGDRAVVHRAATLASGSDVTGAPASSRGATKL